MYSHMKFAIYYCKKGNNTYIPLDNTDVKGYNNSRVSTILIYRQKSEDICMKKTPFGNLDTNNPDELELLEKMLNEKYENSTDPKTDNGKAS